jgi:hypothetical protein
MDTNEQFNGIILLGLLPILLTFLSHSGGYLYYKPNTQHEYNLKNLSDKIYDDWASNSKQKEDTDKGNEPKIDDRIVNYTKDYMRILYDGYLLEMYHEIFGNSEGKENAEEMRKYYNVLDNNNSDSKKVGTIEKMMKDLYHGLVMIFWPIITMVSYLASQFQKIFKYEDSDDNSGENPPITTLEMAFRMLRERYLAGGDEDTDIKEEYIKYIKKLPFQAIWILEGGIGNAIKLSWVNFLIFIFIFTVTLYSTNGGFEFIVRLFGFQYIEESNLNSLTYPFFIYCIGYLFIIYINRNLFKKPDGNITIFNIGEFFKVNTFIMWNLLISFILFSMQTQKSHKFKNNYAFTFNVIILLMILMFNTRDNNVFMFSVIILLIVSGVLI